MDFDKIRAAAIKKLRDAGWLISDTSTNFRICQGIKQVTGQTRPRSETQFSYIKAYVGQDIQVEPEAEPFVPQKAVARNWGRRPAHVPPVHLRAHEIDRLPRPIAMSGVGIGGDSGMGRGR